MVEGPAIGDFKSQRASRSHYWFKSYGNFAEWVDLLLQPAQQACFTTDTVYLSSRHDTDTVSK